MSYADFLHRKSQLGTVSGFEPPWMPDDYTEFLRRKRVTSEPSGIEVSESAISEVLYGFQRTACRWALRRGRAAVFFETGLGKGLVQLEWSRHVPGRVIILAPLAVAQQTSREAAKLGMTAPYVRSQIEADASGCKVITTNYDMLDNNFDPTHFAGVVLDESSVLKAYSGATKRKLIERFSATPFRLCCTATPAPNDHMELGNHGQFLGVMESNEMLARWFINDTMEAGAYRLKRHAERDFWRWVSSWAICATKPSDVGTFDDAAFDLPSLTMATHIVSVAGLAQKHGKLFVTGDRPSATTLWTDKSETHKERCAKVAAIVNGEILERWVVWCETNAESTLLAHMIPDAVEVKGSDPLARKEAMIEAFLVDGARVIISKPSIMGWGLNLQCASRMIFAGLTYSFEGMYQAIRRVWRFGQTRPVTVHLVTAESEVGVLEVIERKRTDHAVMQRAMVAATREHFIHGGSPLVQVEHRIERGEGWTLHVGDSCEVLRGFADDSIDLTISSPPFGNLYIYSDAEADMGNSASFAEFFRHFDFLTPELFRVTKPGRLVAMHCKDLPLYMNRDGAAGLYDFPGDLIRSFERAGFTFHSRVTIWKDPVTEMQRTKNHGLLHKNFTSRREVCRQGMADYLLVFRAWKGEIPDGQIQGLAPVGSYIGDDKPVTWEDERDYSISVWQRYASLVWFDINQMNVLQYRDAREAEDERHICPLQLDVIERAVWLWSNPGDLVLDPFGGIGSVGYVALAKDRRSVSIELKESYADVAIKNFAAALSEKTQGDLFVKKASAAVE